MDDGLLRGVNFGGWLLLERWMTPTLFAGTDAVDEFSFMQTDGAREKINRHRLEFIQESDFVWLVKNGVNAVRIPVGYWVLDDRLPYVNARENLDWAMAMGDKYRISIIIDLHGLPGSQNGLDHSGRVGRAFWYKDIKYRQESLRCLAALAERYKESKSLWGIQVINEPRLGLFHLKLRRFYREAYELLSGILTSSCRIIISDAYTPRLMSGAVRRRGLPVVLDIHLYHMATIPARYLSVDWFLNKTTRRQRMLKRLSRDQPIIIGEWSGVMHHRTMRGVPRHKREELFSEYVKLQQEAYRDCAGWFYWSYKTEQPGQWNFRSQVEAGLIDPTN